MQVLGPQDFSRMVFAASGAPYLGGFHQARPKTVKQRPIPQFFQTAFMAPVPPPANVDQMSKQVQFLEREVTRMSEELKVRSDTSKRERDARNTLTRECDDLREEVGKIRSVLHVRDRQIYELERQLRASQTQLVLLKRRSAAASAAVSAKASPVPGAISSLPREMRTIGTQINEIREMEDRIERLGEALMVEKRRNQRIKSQLIAEDVAAVPPLPSSSRRGSSVPPTRSRRAFVIQSFATTVLHRKVPKLHRETFMEINAIAAVPPVGRSDSPVMISPIRRVDHSSFAVFEDKENGSTVRGVKSPSPTRGAALGGILSPSRPVNTVRSPPKSFAPVKPLPFVPSLNLPQRRPSSSASETAIKQAVAAAILKRRQLAEQGVSLGSARSSIASTSSFLTATPNQPIKARFCVPLG